jgi:hypothetical protein
LLLIFFASIHQQVVHFSFSISILDRGEMFDGCLAIILSLSFIDMSHRILLTGFKDDQYQSYRVDDAFLSIDSFFLSEIRLHFRKAASHIRG